MTNKLVTLGEKTSRLTRRMIYSRAIPDQDVREELETAVRRIPHVRVTVERLALLMTEVIPSENESEPLAQQCVRTGLRACRGGSDQERYRNFLQGLVYDLPVMERYRIRANDGQEEWDPYRETLFEWRKKYQLYPTPQKRNEGDQLAYAVSSARMREILLIRYIFPGSLSLRLVAEDLERISMRTAAA